MATEAVPIRSGRPLLFLSGRECGKIWCSLTKREKKFGAH